MIGSRLFYAAGYNVPENNIEYIDPSRFVLSPKAKTKNILNDKVPLTSRRFEALLDRLPRSCGKDGKLRAMASKFLPGIPVGPI